jgi:hypothetical protein
MPCKTPSSKVPVTISPPLYMYVYVLVAVTVVVLVTVAKIVDVSGCEVAGQSRVHRPFGMMEGE